MSVLETLEICFQANLKNVDAELDRLGDMLSNSAGVGAAEEAGRRMSDLFASGVRSGAGTASDASRDVAASADFSGGAAQARSAGRQLANGFAAGVRDRNGAVQAAVSSMVNAATRKIRSLLAIHSPSKVAEGFGAYFGEGFALGIGGSVSGVERAAGALGDAAVTGLGSAELPEFGASCSETSVQAAVDRALANVQLTVPIHVDGMKLGEASIRGINAVTKSAGKLLLNI